MSTVPDPSVRTATVMLRYWAAARSAAGIAEETLDVSGPVTLADVVAEAVRRHPGTRLPAMIDTSGARRAPCIARRLPRW